MSSLPHGFATWTFDNSVLVQINMNIKIYPRLVRHVEADLFLAPLLRTLPLGFKHVLCVKYYLST
jgi:hypothetical protein